MANKKKEKGSMNWIFWMIGIVLAGVILIVVLDKQMTNNDDESVSVDYENQPFIGDEDAPVSIIEFGDYKCPHCKDFHQAAVPEIKANLVDTGDVKFYFMNFAFMGKDSTRAAEFAETVYQELGNDTFWEFHDQLFERQDEQYTDKLLKEVLSSVTEEENVNKVVSAFEDGAGEKAAKKDKSIGEDLGVHSTPTVVINGKVFEGETFEDLKQAVEEAKNK